MLCELCHERIAAVHITWNETGRASKKLDLCTVCFPTDRSQDEQSALMIRLFEDSSQDTSSGPGSEPAT